MYKNFHVLRTYCDNGINQGTGYNRRLPSVLPTLIRTASAEERTVQFIGSALFGHSIIVFNLIVTTDGWLTDGRTEFVHSILLLNR